VEVDQIYIVTVMHVKIFYEIVEFNESFLAKRSLTIDNFKRNT